MTETKRVAADTEVDALRERLRALGYLDAGVDRFVLAPAHSARGAAAFAVLASLRIGVLGGLLLGPAAAIGLALQLPGLVTSVRDAGVVALYMAVLFGGSIAAAAVVAASIVTLVARRGGGSLARRGRVISTIAGAAVTIGALSYLTLLWTAVRGASAGSHPVLWIAAGLGVAVGVSLLLGHAVTLTALALIVSGTGTPMRTPGVPGTSWRSLLGLGLGAFAGAVVLFNAGGIGAPADRGAPLPPLTVVSSGARVRVIAIDGFDPGVFERVAAADKLPALTAALRGPGARLMLDDEGEAGQPDPARLWTTIATGQPARAHGVQSLQTRRVAGIGGILHGGQDSSAGRLLGVSTDLLRLTRPSVASGTERREKTFWEVAAAAGLRTVVVNWWATWPAVSANGVVLSDRATLRLEHGGPLDAEIAPGSLYPTLEARWPELRARAAALAATAMSTVRVSESASAVLRRSAELDALILVLTAEVTSSRDDLTAVYLPGLDIAQRALASDSTSSRAATLEEYYAVLDSLLADVLQARAGETVLIVTAPGRAGDAAGGRLAGGGELFKAGGSVSAAATDVAATVLYALGVPISRALAGKPLVTLFSDAFARRYPVRYVDTYGPPRTGTAERNGQPLDQEMIDRLRSLGYVR